MYLVMQGQSRNSKSGIKYTKKSPSVREINIVSFFVCGKQRIFFFTRFGFLLVFFTYIYLCVWT